jgi:hypothetical protein
MPTTSRRDLTRTVALGAAVLLAACGGSATPTVAPDAPGTAAPTASAPSDGSPVATEPGAGGGIPDEPGTGGGIPGDPGTGNGTGLPIGPGPVDPGPGQPTIVIPRPGRLNPHPVAPVALAASVDGRHVLVKVSWYGGVAPCAVLDSVKVARSPGTIELTVFEGADALDAICPEIAMLKATIVDLGDLEPGTWSIRATDTEIAPIEVRIS